MILAIVVGLVAGLGAVARYVTDQVVQHQHDLVFPLAEAGALLEAVGNVLGSRAAGLTAAAAGFGLALL